VGTFQAVVGTDSTGGQTGEIDWTYSVSDAQLATMGLTIHDQLTETYTVLVSDGRGGTLSENVVVTVDGPQNVAPVFNSTALGTITEYATPGSTATQLVNGGFDASPLGTGWTQTVTSGLASFSSFFPDNGGESWVAGSYFGNSVPTDASIGQSIATSSGAHYQLNFSLVAFNGSSTDLFEVLWNGQVVDTINASTANTGGYQHYSVTVTGTGGNDQLTFVADDTHANASWFLDTVSLAPTAPLPSIEKTSGTLTFTDANVSDSHTVTQAGPTFSLSGGGTLTQAEIDAVTLSSSLTLAETDSRGTGSGSVAWSYQVPDTALQFLSTGQTLTETYAVTVTDVHGAATAQNEVITIHGTRRR
jgi:VCBS repeat-containing protein